MQHPRPRPGARGNDSGTSLGSDAAFFTPASRKLQVRPARDRFARAMVFEAFGYQRAHAIDFAHDGIPAIIQPVWRGPAPSLECGIEHPILCDLIAWRPAEPAQWWYRWGCDTPALGDEYVEDAHTLGPLYCHRTPLDWLRSGCRGTVLLEFAEHYAPDFGRAAA